MALRPTLYPVCSWVGCHPCLFVLPFSPLLWGIWKCDWRRTRCTFFQSWVCTFSCPRQGLGWGQLNVLACSQVAPPLTSRSIPPLACPPWIEPSSSSTSATFGYSASLTSGQASAYSDSPTTVDSVVIAAASATTGTVAMPPSIASVFTGSSFECSSQGPWSLGRLP